MDSLGTAYNPALWATFFSAEASASAALTGLLFVAISINLQKVVMLPEVTARAAKALATLTVVLLTSTFCLVPGQSPATVGWQMIAIGAVGWAGITILEYKVLKDNPCITRLQGTLQFLLAQSSTLPFIGGGVSLVLGHGGGLYWLVAGILASFVAGLIDAWVLLIEILR
jgi:hypothetical protein